MLAVSIIEFNQYLLFRKKYVSFSLRPFNFVAGYTDILNINLTMGEKVRMFDQKRLSSSFDGVVYETILFVTT